MSDAFCERLPDLLVDVIRIISATDLASRVASSQWIKPNGVTCSIFGSSFLVSPCRYNRDAESAVLLDMRNTIDSSTWPIISAASTVMQTLERFDNRLLAIHRVALADGLHINGTRQALLQELWSLLAVGSIERQNFARNSGILHQTERYVRETTGFAFSAIQLVQGIHSHTSNVQEFAITSASQLTPIRLFAQRLRDVSQKGEKEVRW